MLAKLLSESLFWNFAKCTLHNVEYLSENKAGMSTKSIHPADWFAGGAVGYFDEPGVRGGAVGYFDEPRVRGGAVD